MKPLYILKIGGSVATYKNRSGFSVRNSLLKEVANSIKSARKKRSFDLILIHGAGAAGHQLARKYNLQDGTGKEKGKLRGAFLSRIANQKLNVAIVDLFYSAGLTATSVHTASTVIQKNKRIFYFDLNIIKESLKKGCVPLLYGEMVFDKRLGMSICSGDTIAPYLAEKLKAKKIFFASDIKGVFDKDPHRYKNVKLIERISLKNNVGKIRISDSHNTDATGGMKGKIDNLREIVERLGISIEIFYGFEAKNYEKVLLGRKFPHTTVCK